MHIKKSHVNQASVCVICHFKTTKIQCKYSQCAKGAYAKFTHLTSYLFKLEQTTSPLMKKASEKVMKTMLETECMPFKMHSL